MNNLQPIIQPQKTVWAKGQYSKIGSKLVYVSEQLCESIDVVAGAQVLDVASGHCNTALAAARRECIVTAVDNTEELLQQGQKRSESEGLYLNIVQGDAQNMAFEDGSYDYVLSTFGVQFTQDPQAAADELTRVCREGGKIGLTNWTPTGFAEELNKVLAEYMPASNFPSPYLWGTEKGLTEYFSASTKSMAIKNCTFKYRFPTVSDWFETFSTTYGPIMALYESLPESSRQDLATSVNKVVKEFNISSDSSLILPVNYVEVILTR